MQVEQRQRKLQVEHSTTCRLKSNWGVQNRHTNAPAPLTTASVACLIGSLIASGVWRSINLGTRSTYPYIKVYSTNESM